jgi:hypothetical protein
MGDEENTVVETVEASKRPRKLSKAIEGNILTITEKVTNSVLVFDAGTLPEAIQKNLMPYGLSQKLGDAAAGKEGQVAVDAIKVVWAGLLAGNWSVRASAEEKISKKDIIAKVAEMPEGREKNLAKQLLVKLGLVKE